MKLDPSSREHPRWRRGARLAAKIDRLGKKLEKSAAKGNRFAEFRKLVPALAESEWGEPVEALHLKDFSPKFDVPGRRRDGTIKGKRLIRRFFWNIVRGVINAVLNIVFLFVGSVAGNVFLRNGTVTGPENAQALGFADAARSAKGLWLVCSASRVAVVDSHESNFFADPADSPPPTFLWQSTKPHVPRILPADQRLTWPDGSECRYVVSDVEVVASGSADGPGLG